MQKMYGYIRVSTKEQNEGRQVFAMMEFGVEKKLLIIDKQSGKDFNRPEYQRLVSVLKNAANFLVEAPVQTLYFSLKTVQLSVFGGNFSTRITSIV